MKSLFFRKRTILLLVAVVVFGWATKNGVAAESTSTSYVPLIGISSVPDPLSLPGGPGRVTYHYAVKNFLQEYPLTDVHVVDSKCSPITFIEGDDNGDSRLDASETWRYACTIKISETTQSIATVIGSGNNLPAAHKAYVTVVVGSDNVAPLVNIINVSKISYPLSLPSEGGDVTFTYRVNNPGVVPLGNVIVADDKCNAMSSKLGDTNGNNLLDITEVWVYTCSTHLTQTTTNTVSVTAFGNGLQAVGYSTITVTVAISTFPDTGLNPHFKIAIWAVLVGFLVFLGLLFVSIRKHNDISSIFSRLAGASMIIIATLVLYGWVFNYEFLKRVIPNLVAMNPASAVLFIIFGIFLLLWHTYSQSTSTQVLRALFCIAIATFSLAIIARYAFGVDVHIDELLFSSKLEGNRIALSTAMCFLFSSIVFLCMDIKVRAIRIALQAAILCTLLLVSQGMIAYIYNFAGVFQDDTLIPMAMNTVACFLLLSIGVLAMRKDFEVSIFIRNLFLKSSVHRKVNSALSIGLVIALVIGIVTYTTTRQLIDSSHTATASIQERQLRSQLLNQLVDAETALRGYIITGQGDYLVPYANSISNYPSTFQNLLSVARDPEESVILHRINDLAQLKFEQIAMVINIRRTMGFAPAAEIVKENTGKDYMDQIRSGIEQMNTIDQNNIAVLSRADVAATGRSFPTIIWGTIAQLGAVFLAIIFINKDLKKKK